MLKKMILAILLATNGTVAFAAQQEIVKTENQTKQITEQEQKETFAQKSKKALKTYFVRDTKTKTGLNIAAKAGCTFFIYTLLPSFIFGCSKHNEAEHNKLLCKTSIALALFLCSRELTNY
jgi:hypothetical protein